MFDADFYDTLSRLQLRMTHKSSRLLSGGRPSLQKGQSAEFSDFREYRPGDDLRRLDWNVYARLDRLCVREYMEEKEAVVFILIDTSASMDFGARSKAEMAKELAAAVGFLALNHMDRLWLYDMKDMSRGLSLGGGRSAFPQVLRWLEGLCFEGETDMLQAIRRLPRRGAGTTVMISDFLHPDMLDGEKKSYEKLLGYLDYCRQRPVALHTMAAEELFVAWEGACNLIDAETGRKLSLTMDSRAVARYGQELGRLTKRMKKGCSAARGAYVLCDTGRDRKQLIFQDLKVIYDI